MAVRDKFFALGIDCRDKFKVYDIASKQFTIFKTSPFPHFDSVSKPFFLRNFVLVGKKIVSFTERSSKVYFYDISKDVWTVECCENTKDILCFTILLL